MWIIKGTFDRSPIIWLIKFFFPGDVLRYFSLFSINSEIYLNECGLCKFCSLETEYDFIRKQALLRNRSIGFKKSIYRVEFDKISEEKEPFYSSLPVYFKNTEIGKATSIVWSPKYSKYIGFLISDRKIEKTINDHYIANAKRTSFIVSEIL